MMAYDAAHGQVVLFGGSGPTSLLNDTWTWDGSTWTQQHPANSPSPRTDAMMAYDAARGQVVLFGGFDGYSDISGPLGDTWTWDGNTWTQQFPADSPPARYWGTMAYDAARGQVVLFGGTGENSVMGDTWTWDGGAWTQRSPATSPPARSSPSMAYDAARGEIVLFG
ncbi:MAG: hypothetical protein LBP99_00520, partial [Azoarcus sp.]|nr:hypothetical protein [Azoarcus sp.]